MDLTAPRSLPFQPSEVPSEGGRGEKNTGFTVVNQQLAGITFGARPAC
jgi:hypothetical protein